MKHLTDREIVDLALSGNADDGTAEGAVHLAKCRDCAERLREVESLLAHSRAVEPPNPSAGLSREIFNRAWSDARPGGRDWSSIFRREILRPAIGFAVGLIVGFFPYNSETEASRVGPRLPAGPSVQADGPDGVEPEAEAGPYSPGDSEGEERPTEKGASEGSFWELAGLKNVELTPTVRVEEGRPVTGAVLRGETLEGTLVVWNF